MATGTVVVAVISHGLDYRAVAGWKTLLVEFLATDGRMIESSRSKKPRLVSNLALRGIRRARHVPDNSNIREMFARSGGWKRRMKSADERRTREAVGEELRARKQAGRSKWWYLSQGGRPDGKPGQQQQKGGVELWVA